jgi:hypothetical protein
VATSCRFSSGKALMPSSSSEDLVERIRIGAAAHGQEHVFQEWETLGEDNRNELISDLQASSEPVCCLFDSEINFGTLQA